ncbi:MAG: motility associated factor glycosyltransferase family protein [Deltaproteobacteria bacterium]|nr:motility associated factor glycosyltransferase family protein [Deltaproteobacteria bacterium]
MNFKKNIEAIAKHNKAAYLELIKEREQNGYQFFYEGPVLSVVDPAGNKVRFEKKVALKLERIPKLFVLRGIGDGSLLSNVLSLKETKEVLLYEPHVDFLKGLLDHNDFATLFSDERLRIILGTEQTNISMRIANYLREDSSRLMYACDMLDFVTPYTDHIADNKKYFEIFSKILDQTVRDIQSTATPNVEDAFHGLLNTVRNFPDYFLQPRLNQAKNIHRGMTGVVVSAGPSLSQSLDLLKEHQDRCVIFCCDASLKILLNKGITPDYVACLERIGETVIFFKDMPRLDHTFLVAPAVVSPQTFAAFKGPRLQFSRDSDFENWVVLQKGALNVGASSSHLCMVGLHEMGCSPILLLGQDLCYDPYSGASHDQGAPEEIREHGKMLSDGGNGHDLNVDVEGFGKKQRSMRWWLGFRDMFLRLIDDYGISSVYNMMPPEYGIPISGTERIDPATAFNQFAGTPVDKQAAKSSLLKQKISRQQLLDEAQTLLVPAVESLKFYSAKSLAVMREMSVFFNTHTPDVRGKAHEEKYRDFFKKLEHDQTEIISQGNGFFNRQFFRLFIALHRFVGIKMSQILHTHEFVNNRQEKQMCLLFEWYSGLHLWASRALDLIEDQNKSRWKLW